MLISKMKFQTQGIGIGQIGGSAMEAMARQQKITKVMVTQFTDYFMTQLKEATIVHVKKMYTD